MSDIPIEDLFTKKGAIKPFISKEDKTRAFIHKASTLHGDKYSYKDTKYSISREKLIIGCYTHGDFSQLPTEHLRGQGCPNCAKNKPLTTESFIAKAQVKHLGKYDYTEVNYVNSLTKVSIICKIHGSFLQEANSHLQGCGCPTCAGVAFDTVYVWKFHNYPFFKVGVCSSGRLATRVKEVARAHNTSPQLLLDIKVDDALIHEHRILDYISSMFTKPLTDGAGYTEIFLAENADEFVNAVRRVI